MAGSSKGSVASNVSSAGADDGHQNKMPKLDRTGINQAHHSFRKHSSNSTAPIHSVPHATRINEVRKQRAKPHSRMSPGTRKAKVAFNKMKRKK